MIPHSHQSPRMVENAQEDVNVDTKGSVPPHQLRQSGNTVLFASVPYRPPEPGSNLHLVEFLRDFLEQNAGKAHLGVLRKCVFNSYRQKYSQCSYLCKKFLRSYPEYFDISDGTNFCIVKLHKPMPPTSDAAYAATKDDTSQPPKSKDGLPGKTKQFVKWKTMYR